MKKVYLASKSPRRREILESLGLEVEVIASNDAVAGYFAGDEVVYEDEQPCEYVERTALQKFREGLGVRAAKGGDASIPVLAADTVVSIDGEVLGKPEDEAQAEEFLRRLSGRVHEVRTSVVVGLSEADFRQTTQLTTVEFEEVPSEEARAYVLSKEPYDKAGGYGIQGKASLWIKTINGSYTSVMGLPVHEASRLLKSYGIDFN